MKELISLERYEDKEYPTRQEAGIHQKIFFSNKANPLHKIIVLMRMLSPKKPRMMLSHLELEK